jgi:hypothetical protein
MEHWTRHKSQRGTASLKAIRIIGFNHPLVLDDGRHIKNWREDLRTQLLLKAKEIRKTAEEQFARSQRTFSELESEAGAVRPKETGAVMIIESQGPCEMDQQLERPWDVLEDADEFVQDDKY